MSGACPYYRESEAVQAQAKLGARSDEPLSGVLAPAHDRQIEPT